jgi:opacity protein-like surface antigen
MRKWSLLLLLLALSSSRMFAQDNAGSSSNGSAGYVSCPVGQSNIFLYQTVTNFEVLSSLKCGDQVEILGRVDTLGGYLRVRTADGKEGFVPQSQITQVAPPKSRIAIVQPPPQPVAAGQGAPLAGPLSHGHANLGYDIPRAEIFGGYSYVNQDWEAFASRSGMQGWDASATVNVYPWLGVEGNVAGNYQRNCIGAAGLTCSAYTYMGGPKITAYRNGNLTVFGHGLAGLGALTMTLAGSPLTWRDLAWAAGGGIDYAVTNNISVRAGSDYFRTEYMQSIGGTHQNNIRASVGVVFRLGRVISE